MLPAGGGGVPCPLGRSKHWVESSCPHLRGQRQHLTPGPDSGPQREAV